MGRFVCSVTQFTDKYSLCGGQKYETPNIIARGNICICCCYMTTTFITYVQHRRFDFCIDFVVSVGSQTELAFLKCCFSYSCAVTWCLVWEGALPGQAFVFHITINSLFDYLAEKGNKVEQPFKAWSKKVLLVVGSGKQDDKWRTQILFAKMTAIQMLKRIFYE
jgi:hypothetical protein